MNGAFFELAKIQTNGETLDSFHKAAKAYVIEGLRILNTLTQETNARTQNLGEKEGVIAWDQKFDLSDPFDFQILSAIVNLKIDGLKLSKELESTTDENWIGDLKDQITLNKLNQESLFSLKNQDIETGFTNNSLLLVNPQDLGDFARALHVITTLNYPVPRVWFFGPHRKYGGRYSGREQAEKSTLLDYADMVGSIDSLTHELGHYVSDVSSQINPDFSLQKFSELMDRLEQKHLDRVADENSLFYSQTEKDRGEQYATFFAEYLVRGEILRKRISEERQVDPHAWAILQEMYIFFRDGFEDAEFVRDVLTQEELNKNSQEFNPPMKDKTYQIGQQVTINDDDSHHPGVFLREQPSGLIDEETKAVFDEDLVEIIDGPFPMQELDYQGNVVSESNWWRVKIIWQEILGSSSIGRQAGAEGWIKEDYLSEIFKP